MIHTSRDAPAEPCHPTGVDSYREAEHAHARGYQGTNASRVNLEVEMPQTQDTAEQTQNRMIALLERPTCGGMTLI